MPTLSEAESKAMLAAHGLPVLDEALVSSPDEAASAASRIGFPVAAKLCGRAIAHKTERGLVRLGLGDEAAVRQATQELLGAATPDDGDVAVLVSPMVRGIRELIAGVVRDPQFGPCVMLGVGGVLAEAVADVAFRLVPLEPVDAEDLVDALRTSALLGPLRGEPAVDRGALVDVLLALSRTAEAEPGIRSIDLNPIIVSEGRPVAVDALVEVEQ